VKVIFFNARGLEHDVEDVKDYLIRKGIAVAAISEKWAYENDFGDDAWLWLRGPEHLPLPGDARSAWA
jgi:hypothetical protein